MYQVYALSVSQHGENSVTVLAHIDELTREALATVCEVYDFEIDSEHDNAADAFVKFGKRAPEIVCIELANDDTDDMLAAFTNPLNCAGPVEYLGLKKDK